MADGHPISVPESSDILERVPNTYTLWIGGWFVCYGEKNNSNAGNKLWYLDPAQVTLTGFRLYGQICLYNMVDVYDV